MTDDIFRKEAPRFRHVECDVVHANSKELKLGEMLAVPDPDDARPRKLALHSPISEPCRYVKLRDILELMSAA